MRQKYISATKIFLLRQNIFSATKKNPTIYHTTGGLSTEQETRRNRNKPEEEKPQETLTHSQQRPKIGELKVSNM